MSTEESASKSESENIEKDPSFDPHAHHIISFRELLENNEQALQQIKQEFKNRGWCFVRFPDAPIKITEEDTMSWLGRTREKLHKFPIDVKAFANELTTFFDKPESEKAASLGYSSVPHKESIHITTPYPTTYPPTDVKRGTLEDLCTLWDEVTVDLLQAIAKGVFGCTAATLTHRADLPVAWSRHQGMFDVAHYLNKQTATLSHEVGFSTQDVNCVPHYDPGFLSISFLSTNEGLQLKDPQTGAWFAGPVNTVAGQEDLGVIWLGEAAAKASKGVFKEGVHRVVYPQTPVPRIAAWYEMCTLSQVNEEIQSTLPTKGTMQLHNLPNSKPLTLKGDRRLIERHYGIPMSKSGAPFKNQYLRAAYSEDRKQEARKENSEWEGGGVYAKFFGTNKSSNK